MSNYLLPHLNDLALAIHANSLRLGWYDPAKVRPFDGMLMNVVAEVAEAQEEWRAGRGVNEYHWTVKGRTFTQEDPVLKFIDGKLCVHNYERVGGYDPEPEWLEMTPMLLRSMPNMIPHLKPEGIPPEFADIIIRVLDMCGRYRIDIAAAIADKMAFNETREYRHGNKRS